MAKIIYLHPHFTSPGGAGKFVLETGNLLSKNGYEVKVISIKAANKIIRGYKRNIEFIDIGGPLSSSFLFWLFFPLSYIKVARLLNKEKDFILFPQVFPANWWGFIYKLFHPRIKMIWMCQEPSAFIHSAQWINSIPSMVKRLLARLLYPLLALIDKFLAKTPDLILANSNYTKKYAKKVYGYSDEKIKTLYLGVDHSFFKLGNLKKNKNQILTVGRLTKFKNDDILIKAFKTVREKIDAKLVIVGEGEEKESLRKLTADLGLSNSVKFTGTISNEELRKYYQESNVFVLCSENEPFGLVTVEAMACGAPVIAIKSGGPSEIIIDGKNGYLLSSKNSQSLSTKINSILTNEELQIVLSLSTVKRARDFSWTKTSVNLIRYIEDVL